MTALSADERQELAQSVRSACERLASEPRVRAVAYGEGDRGEEAKHSGFDSALWDVLCNQVGVAAIALPEHLGGAGYGPAALGVVAHELGRALAPVPFVSSAVLATGLLMALTENDPDADKRLTGLIEGRRTAAAALTGDGGLWRPSAVTLRAAPPGTTGGSTARCAMCSVVPLPTTSSSPPSQRMASRRYSCSTPPSTASSPRPSAYSTTPDRWPPSR